jgi:hypothetical protein
MGMSYLIVTSIIANPPTKNSYAFKTRRKNFITYALSD